MLLQNPFFNIALCHDLTIAVPFKVALKENGIFYTVKGVNYSFWYNFKKYSYHWFYLPFKFISIEWYIIGNLFRISNWILFFISLSMILTHWLTSNNYLQLRQWCHVKMWKTKEVVSPEAYLFHIWECNLFNYFPLLRNFCSG